MKKKTVLTIAGSDSSGGAGIQADIKAITMNGVYASSVITALTAQNTTGVYGILETPADFIAAQMDAVFSDIFPDAVKIGMLPSPEAMECVAAKLRQYKPEHIVLDPVMVSTSGHRLMEPEAEETLKAELFPLAELITPNIPEAEVLTGLLINDDSSMEHACRELFARFHCAILLKSGHRTDHANDLLYTGDETLWIKGERIDNPNSHGTGCTLSSTIAANLAKGYSLGDAVAKAKEYLTEALRVNLDLGNGHGHGRPCPRWTAYFLFLQLNTFKFYINRRKLMTQYTTQMDAARKGIVTSQIKTVAEKEHMPVEKMMQLVAEGKVAICANKHHTCLNPEGVGSMLRTKINVNLGVSRDCKDYDIEMQKVMKAVDLGAEAIIGPLQPWKHTAIPSETDT